MGIEGLVLAAGLSSRAGCYKMTLRIDGSTVIEKCIEGMYDLCSRIIVIGGYRVEELRRVLSKYAKVEIILNSNYEDGMISSVKLGFNHVCEERCFITPGDYPMINKNVYEDMSMAEGDIIVPVYHGKKGHPVLFKTLVAKELLVSKDDKTLKEFIDRKGFVQVQVQEPGILIDIDTMEDYNKLLGFYS